MMHRDIVYGGQVGLCVFFINNVESLHHLLFSFPFSRTVWEKVMLWVGGRVHGEIRLCSIC